MTNSTLQADAQPAWRCIEFSAQHRYSPASGVDAHRRPVAMLFGKNGCRPRLACVEFLSRSDAVMQYRVGSPVTWPVADTSAELVCSDENFAEQRYRSVVSREKQATSTVACEIDAWYRLNGSDSRGQPLEGFVEACRRDHTTFRYVINTTSSVTSEETHRCLATFTEGVFNEFKYIITASLQVSNPAAPPQLFCWLLEKSPLHANPRLYLTYAADCYPKIQNDIEYNGYTGYIAQFDLVSSDEGQEWIRNCSSNPNPVPVVTPGLRTTPGLGAHPGPGSSATPETDESKAHHLLVNTAAAAAVTGMALLINQFR